MSAMPVPCMVTNCPNCITPGSAFVMHKRGMKCVRIHPKRLFFSLTVRSRSSTEHHLVVHVVENVNVVLPQTDGVSRGGPLCEKCVWKCVGPIAFLITDDVQHMAANNLAFQAFWSYSQNIVFEISTASFEILQPHGIITNVLSFFYISFLADV